MSVTPQRNGATPPRTKIPQPMGKPLQVVNGADGTPLIDGRHFLAWHAPSGRYFVGRTDPRVYLGRDLDAARFRFREYVKGRQEDPSVWAQMGRTIFVDAKDDAPPVDLKSLIVKPIYRLDDPDLLGCVRAFILRDPREAARRLDIPELARLTELPPVEPSRKLEDIGQEYLDKKPALAKHWRDQVARHWKEFRESVKVTTVADVTAEHIQQYGAEVYAEYERGQKPTYVRHRFASVVSVFNHAMTRGNDQRQLRRVLDLLKMLTPPRKSAVNPKPITPEQFAALLKVADVKFRAILLLSLNAALYNSEVAALKRDDIDLDAGVLRMHRGKTGLARVAVLWSRTIDAIRAYQAAAPHKSPSLFVNADGGAYTGKNLARYIRETYRPAAGLGDDVTYDRIRDGALSAAADCGDVLAVKALAGHSTGQTDAYLLRKPRIVAGACAAIERAYFGPQKRGKK